MSSNPARPRGNRSVFGRLLGLEKKRQTASSDCRSGFGRTFQSEHEHRRRWLRVEPLEPRLLLTVVPEMLVELGFGTQSIRAITEVGSDVYFVASTREHGEELWRVDSGSPTGVSLVADINLGAGSSFPSSLINLGGTLFFTANDGTHGNELWKSDGTAAGTELVKNIRPGSTGLPPRTLTNLSGTLFFRADDGTSGFELWKSDGTTAGTELVKDIRPGSGSSYPGGLTNYPVGLTNVGGTLFFSANDGTNGFELWKSDGTQSGTELVTDILPGIGSSSPYHLTNVGGTLFFRVNDGTDGVELWKSNGTAAGTVLVKDSWPWHGNYVGPNFLTNMGGTLFFSALDATNGAFDGNNGLELWKSDGTPAGTVVVKDIRPGEGSSYPQQLTNVGGTLFFSANDGTNGYELWKSDGTPDGTVVVKDINSGSGGSRPNRLFDGRGTLINVGGTLFFSANDGTNGVELWKSDGTAAGTVLVQDINSGIGSSSPYHLTNVGGTLFFSAVGEGGLQLWSTTGEAINTLALTQRDYISSLGSFPSEFIQVGSLTFFVAYEFSGEAKLMRTDGSAAGTVMVKILGPGSSSRFSLTNLAGTLFFRAFDGMSGYELWKSDGTTVGTELVKDIRPGSYGSYPSNLIDVGGTLFFTAFDGTNGVELWKSDGTAAGTELVKDISPVFYNSGPHYFTNVGGTVFFIANDGTHGNELWKSDGTTAGTVLVKDIRPGSGGSNPRSLTNVGGTLFFNPNDGTHGVELWKSDGTLAGTELVSDVRPGSSGSFPSNLINVGGTVFFTASDGTHGNELWKSDGTLAGTELVSDVRPGSSGAIPSNLINVGGTVFFTAHDGTHGNELWKSDGTAAGTVLVKDIRPGNGSSYSGRTTNVGGTLFFSANDGTHGAELWKSDGTAAGTVLVSDIRPGSSGSNITHLLNGGGTLFFQADDGVTGAEPWILRPSAVQVLSGQVYHKGSAFAEGSSNILAALDTVKQLAKESATTQTLNYDHLINTSRGINGLVFDISRRLEDWTVDDFKFQVSPSGAFVEADNPPQDWQTAPVPSAITTLTGTPSRVIVEWPDNAIANRWLRITIKATANTGLTEHEVYYLGHLRGETDSSTTGGVYTVSFADITPIRSAVGQTTIASNVYDLDKDGSVAIGDIAAMRSNIGTQLTNITIPAIAFGGGGAGGGNGVAGLFTGDVGVGATTISLEERSELQGMAVPSITPSSWPENHFSKVAQLRFVSSEPSIDSAPQGSRREIVFRKTPPLTNSHGTLISQHRLESSNFFPSDHVLFLQHTSMHLESLDRVFEELSWDENRDGA